MFTVAMDCLRNFPQTYPSRARGPGWKSATSSSTLRRPCHSLTSWGEGDGPQRHPLLADAETQVPLAAAQPRRFADHLQVAGQKQRPAVAVAVRLQPVQLFHESQRQGTERHLGVED
jgi:hypothetical protein